MFDVVPLGTGSALPTKARHLSGTAVRRDGHVVLFDCGEGTQLQMAQAGLGRGRLDAVCITHLHGDHLYGLPGLITTLALLGRTSPLTVVGPEALRGVLEAMPGLDAERLPFEVRHVGLAEGFDHAVVYEDDHVTVEARPIEHRVFCAGYRYAEKTRPGHVDGPAARAAGLTTGDQFEAIKRGEGVVLADGTVVSPEGLVGPPRPGAAFAYVLDTVPCATGVELARGADLLLHEATFGDAFVDRAAEVGHSTARQAAGVARDAGARRLLITHFSARYGDVSGLVAEAREVFPETEAAQELAVYTVGGPGVQTGEPRPPAAESSARA
ncbi:MAG TPA: ribonuclease Z [Rubricoccaceae bacterium]